MQKKCSLLIGLCLIFFSRAGQSFICPEAKKLTPMQMNALILKTRRSVGPQLDRHQKLEKKLKQLLNDRSSAQAVSEKISIQKEIIKLTTQVQAAQSAALSSSRLILSREPISERHGNKLSENKLRQWAYLKESAIAAISASHDKDPSPSALSFTNLEIENIYKTKATPRQKAQKAAQSFIRQLSKAGIKIGRDGVEAKKATVERLEKVFLLLDKTNELKLASDLSSKIPAYESNIGGLLADMNQTQDYLDSLDRALSASRRLGAIDSQIKLNDYFEARITPDLPKFFPALRSRKTYKNAQGRIATLGEFSYVKKALTQGPSGQSFFPGQALSHALSLSEDLSLFDLSEDQQKRLDQSLLSLTNSANKLRTHHDKLLKPVLTKQGKDDDIFLGLVKAKCYAGENITEQLDLWSGVSTVLSGLIDQRCLRLVESGQVPSEFISRYRPRTSQNLIRSLLHTGKGCFEGMSLALAETGVEISQESFEAAKAIYWLLVATNPFTRPELRGKKLNEVYQKALSDLPSCIEGKLVTDLEKNGRKILDTMLMKDALSEDDIGCLSERGRSFYVCRAASKAIGLILTMIYGDQANIFEKALDAGAKFLKVSKSLSEVKKVSAWYKAWRKGEKRANLSGLLKVISRKKVRPKGLSQAQLKDAKEISGVHFAKQGEEIFKTQVPAELRQAIHQSVANPKHPLTSQHLEEFYARIAKDKKLYTKEKIAELLKAAIKHDSLDIDDLNQFLRTRLKSSDYAIPEELIDDLQNSHLIGMLELGQDGNPARVNHYTWGQLRRKRRKIADYIDSLEKYIDQKLAKRPLKEREQLKKEIKRALFEEKKLGHDDDFARRGRSNFADPQRLENDGLLLQRIADRGRVDGEFSKRLKKVEKLIQEEQVVQYTDIQEILFGDADLIRYFLKQMDKKGGRVEGIQYLALTANGEPLGARLYEPARICDVIDERFNRIPHKDLYLPFLLRNLDQDRIDSTTLHMLSHYDVAEIRGELTAKQEQQLRKAAEPNLEAFYPPTKLPTGDVIPTMVEGIHTVEDVVAKTKARALLHSLNDLP